MKKCELCESPARSFCESDQASLCWVCDAKVHGANFLVARHSRGLLCHTCQSLTPWRAAGSKLGRTISVCERCTGESHSRRREQGREGGGGEDDDGEEGSGDSGSANNDDVDTEEDDLGDQDENDEADGDNQVVPWSFTTPPPPASSLSSASTSSGDSVSRFACSDGEFFESSNAVSLKRTRYSPADPRSPLREVLDRPFSKWEYNRSVLTTQAGGCDSFSKPVKHRRTDSGFPAVQAGSAGISSLSRDFNETKPGKLKEKC